MDITLGALARELEGRALGDVARRLTGVASLDAADPGDVAFVDSARRMTEATKSRAGCLLIPEGVDPCGRDAIAVAHPKLAFVTLLARVHPEPTPPPGIHASAVVDASAVIAHDAHLGPLVVVGARAVVGAGAVIGAGSVLGDDSVVGPGSRLHPRVVLYPGVKVGARAILHAGVVLGADGFGYVRDAIGRLHKFPQLGGLVLGDDVEIGANTTIDRAALGTTRIGDGSKLDNLVQIAHNVIIGEHVAISAQVGIAGSSTLEDGVTLGGQVGLGDHVRVRRGATIAAQSGVASGKVVRGDAVLWGTPARPLPEVKRQIAELRFLSELRAEVRLLREVVDRLAAATG